MTAAIERFLEKVRTDPGSSLEMVDLIEEILTKQYLANADDNTQKLGSDDRVSEITSREDLTLKERCEALASLFLEA
jgi:hypothetical protein